MQKSASHSLEKLQLRIKLRLLFTYSISIQDYYLHIRYRSKTIIYIFDIDPRLLFTFSISTQDYYLHMFDILTYFGIVYTLYTRFWDYLHLNLIFESIYAIFYQNVELSNLYTRLWNYL